MTNIKLDNAKKAGKIHYQIRNEILEWIEPNMKYIDICERIEHRIKELTNYSIDSPLTGGIAFPTGVSTNHCAAHWTPNPQDKNIYLTQDDICKIDYGVHLNGVIVDSAFTVSFNSKYDNLLEASKTSTDLGIKLSGPDAILSEIGKEIQENLESYEIELDGKIYPIKSIKDLTGHQIEPYKIHAKKRVPNFYLENYKERMEENEFYAIETFASTNYSKVFHGKDCSHYMLNYDVEYKQIPLGSKERKLLSQIEQYFGTLAFCNRWLHDLKFNRYEHHLKTLVKNNVVTKYPPIYDNINSYVAQFEHTIHINDKGNEVLSLPKE